MSTLIAKIHIAKSQLGLDDAAYRAVLASATGKTSTKVMSQIERIRALKAFERLGFSDQVRPSGKGGQKTTPASVATGRYAPILKALWLSAWNLGIVANRADKALIAFVQRQSGVAHTRFLTDEADARRAIEGLKGWIARKVEIEWPGRGPVEAKRAVVAAQLRILGKAFAGIDLADPTLTGEALDRAQADLGRKIRVKAGV